MITKPGTFPRFPTDKTCPVCGTSEDTECVLIPIDGTRKDNICEAAIVHLWCAVAKQYSRGHDPDDAMLYTWAEHDTAKESPK